MHNKYLIVIAGPTAVGKTALCIQLARKLSTEIISADSRQFYKKIPIGTAQPTEEEKQGIPHHFLNFLPLDQDYSAGKFEKNALTQLSKLFANHQCAILTGGSGLYIKAVCEGLPDITQIDSTIRNRLNATLAQKGIEYLVELLATVDPIYYKEVDSQNPQRVIRALEVCEGTGQPYSTLRKQLEYAPKRPFNIIKIGLMRDKAQLTERIRTRVDQMVVDGLLEEAKALYDYRSCNALQTLGYREVFDYLAGNITVEEAIEEIKINTRKYAKRQLTWFKKDKEMDWFHPDDYSGIKDYICKTMLK